MKNFTHAPFTLLTIAGTLFLNVACNREPSVADGGARRVVSALLSSTSGSGASGTVRFEAVQNGVRIIANLSGLTPGDHGFHIHEHGDCSAPDASTAGGHFNPTNHSHAGPDAAERHVGDLGNLTAGADGRATIDRVDSMLTLSGPNSIVGRSVVVHAGPDDLKTQPSGGAGGRVACGVIQSVP